MKSIAQLIPGSLFLRVTNLLDSLQIEQRSMGYIYLRDAIIHTYNQNGAWYSSSGMSGLNRLYWLIAGDYMSTPDKVTEALSDTIKQGWQNTEMKPLYNKFSIAEPKRWRPPTTGKFIFTVAHLLLKEDGKKSIKPRFEIIYKEPQVNLYMPIEQVGLSGRTRNCLKRIGVKDVSNLFCETIPNKLARCRNMGHVSFQELMDKMDELGFNDWVKEAKLRVAAELLPYTSKNNAMLAVCLAGYPTCAELAERFL